jgi:hypothetical protein
MDEEKRAVFLLRSDSESSLGEMFNDADGPEANDVLHPLAPSPVPNCSPRGSTTSIEQDLGGVGVGSLHDKRSMNRLDWDKFFVTIGIVGCLWATPPSGQRPKRGLMALYRPVLMLLFASLFQVNFKLKDCKNELDYKKT